jgi:hypothetical protein
MIMMLLSHRFDGMLSNERKKQGIPAKVQQPKEETSGLSELVVVANVVYYYLCASYFKYKQY